MKQLYEHAEQLNVDVLLSYYSEFVKMMHPVDVELQGNKSALEALLKVKSEYETIEILNKCGCDLDKQVEEYEQLSLF